MTSSTTILTDAAKSIRRAIVRMAHFSRASHSGSALSIVDVLVVLYWRVMRCDPARPQEAQRDRFILSKGHASAALYAALAERGYFDSSLLEGYYRDGGALPGHIDHTAVPGIEASMGSLGHGLSLGAGMALALAADGLASRVFVLLGDGELNEGSVWEAFMFIAHRRLLNLTVLVDCNSYQGYGSTGCVLDMSPLEEKLRAFGWECVWIDGHDFAQIERALAPAADRPRAILARTVKGKGVSYMENQFVWHYRSPDSEQLALALKELE